MRGKNMAHGAKPFSDSDERESRISLRAGLTNSR
jgi:hypothetical protein